MDDRNTEGRRLQQLREAWGYGGYYSQPMPQRALAVALGVDVGTLSRWERGARPIAARVRPWLQLMAEADGMRGRLVDKHLVPSREYDSERCCWVTIAPDPIAFWREIFTWSTTASSPSWATRSEK